MKMIKKLNEEANVTAWKCTLGGKLVFGGISTTRWWLVSGSNCRYLTGFLGSRKHVLSIRLSRNGHNSCSPHSSRWCKKHRRRQSTESLNRWLYNQIDARPSVPTLPALQWMAATFFGSAFSHLSKSSQNGCISSIIGGWWSSKRKFATVPLNRR